MKTSRRRASFLSRRGRSTSHVAGSQPDNRRLRFEPLEDRRMLATLMVNSADDNLIFGDGLVTLREAIVAANNNSPTVTDLGETGDIGPDTIVFDPAVFSTPQTISLSLNDDIEIKEALTINGPGQELLTIDAQLDSRIFDITATTGDFTIGGITLTDGRVLYNPTNPISQSRGGAIRSLTTGSLTIALSTIKDSFTSGNLNDDTGQGAGHGGGIYSVGRLTLIQSTVSGNSTRFDTALGGGIYSFSHTTLIQSTISGNQTFGAGAHGGGMNVRGQLELFSSTVSGNFTSRPRQPFDPREENADGGGIYAFGNVTLSNSTVSGNETEGRNSDGGGIFARGNVTLTNSTVSDNSTLGNYAKGGGIFSLQDVILVGTASGSTVSGNSTAGKGSSGGGIYSEYSNVTATRGTISGNSTTGDGARGGGIFSRGNVTLTNSTVRGNSTNDGGGGVHSVGGVTATGSTVSGNVALSSGGGIWSQGAVTLTQSTITDNHVSPGSGGGIMMINDPLVIVGSIVAGNTASAGMDDINPGSGTLNVNFSLIEQTGLTFVGGDNIIGMPANLAPLANNAGPTQTHALLASSPAIDAGSPFVAFDPAEFDQRGSPFVRVYDGGVNGLRIDMGAYERQTLPASFLVVDTPLDGDDGVYSAGFLSLREVVNLTQSSIGADTITFDPMVFATPQTMLLTLGDIEISEAVTIEGPGQHLLTIDAQQQSRIFDITATTGDFTLSGMTLTGGQTNVDGILGAGGAIRSLTSGILTIDQNTVRGNNTMGESADGGGIYAFGDVTLLGSTIRGNSTAGELSDGGGLFSAGDVTATLSTVSGNSTTGDFARSGGIRANGAVTLTQSTVSGNSTAGSSAYGGGLSSSGIITLTQSTVTGNSTASLNAEGGGISNDNDLIMITNSIVAGNTAGGGMNDIRPGSGTLDVNFSLIQQTGLTIVGGDNIIGQSANLAPLANNGGPTWTHALASNSPALDAGDPSILFDANEFDQRGAPFVRVFDGNAVVGARIDIGAYERQTVAGLDLVVDTPIDENDGDYSAGDLSLREAVGLANGSIGDNTITFDAAVFDMPLTMLLSLGEFGISEAVSIDGPGQALLTIDAQQQSRIFNITATTGDFTLAGLTLTGGRTIVDSISSVGLGSGGAVRSLTTGNLTIDQSTISGNSTEGNYGRGGGIFSTRNLTLTGSTVSNNSTSGIGAVGGGVFAFNATLTGSTVSDNSTTGGSSTSNGGGIYSIVDTALNQSRVSGNSSSNRGGGIYSFNGSITLTDSTVSGNSAASRGGGIEAKGSVTLNNSTLSGNVAIQPGGGIYARVDVTLSNSTVSGNRTTGGYAVGGGITVFRNLTITNSTVSGNTTAMSNASGGGIWHDSGALAITNSIVAGNTAAGGMDDIRPGGGSFDVNFSLIQQTGLTFNGGDNILGQSANLGPLQSNGGSTETHALLAGSPAIDAGDPSIVFSSTEFDQRGAPFVRVSGGRIDIGAFESQPIAISADFDNDGDVDGRDFLAWQRGLGTPNALKADGDADNDLDVDGDDLGVWQGQYGNVPPLEALSQESSAEHPEPEISSEFLLSSELVDLALAVEWMEQSASERDLYVDVQANYDEAVRDAAFASGDILSTSVLASEYESLTTASNDEDAGEEAWLTEKLLERVFGY